MNRVVIDADGGEHVMSRHIFGHFAEHLGRCIYDGIWVGPDSPIPNVRGIRLSFPSMARANKAPIAAGHNNAQSSTPSRGPSRENGAR